MRQTVATMKNIFECFVVGQHKKVSDQYAVAYHEQRQEIAAL